MLRVPSMADDARRRAVLFNDTFQRGPEALAAALEQAFDRPATEAEMGALTLCARRYISTYRNGSQREHYQKARDHIEKMRDALNACVDKLQNQWELLEEATGANASEQLGDDELTPTNHLPGILPNIDHVLDNVRFALALERPVSTGNPLSGLIIDMEVRRNRLELYMDRFSEANGINNTGGRPAREAVTLFAKQVLELYRNAGKDTKDTRRVHALWNAVLGALPEDADPRKHAPSGPKKLIQRLLKSNHGGECDPS